PKRIFGESLWSAAVSAASAKRAERGGASSVSDTSGATSGRDGRAPQRPTSAPKTPLRRPLQRNARTAGAHLRLATPRVQPAAETAALHRRPDPPPSGK